MIAGVGIALALLAGMLAMMAARVPIALAMLVPGAIGYVALAGWPPFASYLKGLACARLAKRIAQGPNAA